MSPELSCVDKANKMMDQKTDYTLIIHSHSYAKPENLEKIGPVNFESGLIRIVKNKKQQQPGITRGRRVGPQEEKEGYGGKDLQKRKVLSLE